ncbi:MAG: hypothetical protein RBR87_14720 [Bacteroidales bacterium]|nr:hypothetical protein [Bacteroidales bacterium]
MKSVFIAYNQAHTERINFIFDRFKIKGYTQWDNVSGRGSETGEPHLGTHTWPEQNSAIITIVEDEKVEELLEAVKKLDEINKDVGIRAFVWNIEQVY